MNILFWFCFQIYYIYAYILSGLGLDLVSVSVHSGLVYDLVLV